MRNLILVKVSGSEVTHLVELPDSELTHLVQLAQTISEPDLHMLFDMTLKGTQDVLRSHNPQMVLEVVLLRLASAPSVIDLRKAIEGLAQSGGAFPKQNEESAAANSGSASPLVMTCQAVVNKNSSASPNKIARVNKMDFVSHKNLPPTEKWLLFIDLVRYEDALFAAKIENLIFVDDSKNILNLAVPTKLIYLKEQMKEPQIRQKMQGYIDSFWGESYSFEVSLNSKEGLGDTAVQLLAQKKLAEEEEFRQQLMKEPRIQLALKLFKSTIVDIKDIKSK